MIQVNYLPFKIDLAALQAHVESSIPGTDGIIASDINFLVVCPDTPENAQVIQDYLATLTQEGELEKLAYPEILRQAIVTYKQSLLTKPYSALSVMDRKLLMSLALTPEEEAAILNEVG